MENIEKQKGREKQVIGRRDLAKEVAAEIEMDAQMIQNLFSLLLDKMIEHLQNGEEIRFKSFGSFLLVEKEGGIRDPETGDKEIKRERSLAFVPGSKLKDAALNKEKKKSFVCEQSGNNLK